MHEFVEHHCSFHSEKLSGLALAPSPQELGINARQQQGWLPCMTCQGEEPLRRTKLLEHADGHAALGVHVRLGAWYVSHSGVDSMPQSGVLHLALPDWTNPDSSVAGDLLLQPVLQQEVDVVRRLLKSVVHVQKPGTNVLCPLAGRLDSTGAIWEQVRKHLGIEIVLHLCAPSGLLQLNGDGRRLRGSRCDHVVELHLQRVIICGIGRRQLRLELRDEVQDLLALVQCIRVMQGAKGPHYCRQSGWACLQSAWLLDIDDSIGAHLCTSHDLAYLWLGKRCDIHTTPLASWPTAGQAEQVLRCLSGANKLPLHIGERRKA